MNHFLSKARLLEMGQQFELYEVADNETLALQSAINVAEDHKALLTDNKRLRAALDQATKGMEIWEETRIIHTVEPSGMGIVVGHVEDNLDLAAYLQENARTDEETP